MAPIPPQPAGYDLADFPFETGDRLLVEDTLEISADENTVLDGAFADEDITTSGKRDRIKVDLEINVLENPFNEYEQQEINGLRIDRQLNTGAGNDRIVSRVDVTAEGEEAGLVVDAISADTDFSMIRLGGGNDTVIAEVNATGSGYLSIDGLSMDDEGILRTGAGNDTVIGRAFAEFLAGGEDDFAFVSAEGIRGGRIETGIGDDIGKDRIVGHAEAIGGEAYA